MVYTLNSAKDALGNEQAFVETFQKNRAAIVDYQRRRGGDLEGAFQAITGQPWPAGRSVKIKNGQVEMTKDRTVKSVLGKYVLPIAGAVAAPYVLPALLGGGGAAAGAAAAAGSGGAAGAAGAGVAAAAAPSIWGAIAPSLIGAGASLGGAALAARGVSSAAKTQADAADKALAVQKEQYELQRADLAPYRGLGTGAVEALRHGMGYPAAPPPTLATLGATGTAPAAAQGAPAAPAPSNSGYVAMRTPDGRTVMLPPDRIAEATQRGAQRI